MIARQYVYAKPSLYLPEDIIMIHSTPARSSLEAASTQLLRTPCFSEVVAAQEKTWGALDPSLMSHLPLAVLSKPLKITEFYFNVL